MNTTKLISIALAALLFDFGAAGDAGAEAAVASGTIELAMSGLENDSGVILVALFDRPEAFPSDSKRAVRTMKVRVKGRKARAAIKDVPHGTYAISVLHDENSNGKLDTNFLGIPVEHLGASNNAPFRFGPPSWQDARFKLDTKKTTLRIKLRSVL